MQTHDWIELFRLIPAEQHNSLVLTTLSGVDLNVDTILRTEPSYIVFRGRVSGNTDDGRVFFLPFRQIDFLQINREVREVEIRKLYGEDVDETAGANAQSSSDLPESPPAKPGSFQGVAAAGSPSPSVAGSLPGQPAPAVPQRGSAQGVAARLSNPPASAQTTVIGRLSNVPTSALHPQTAAPRLSNVPPSALIPPAAADGSNGNAEQATPPRNSILERLRAQRNSILPPRPPSR